MPADWVTVKTFALTTGIDKEEARRKCANDEWPEGIAWVYYSDRVRLINLNWWNTKWQETARASRKRRKTVLKSNSTTTLCDVESVSNVNQLLLTLEK
jgi:hypothetical protein